MSNKKVVLISLLSILCLLICTLLSISLGVKSIRFGTLLEVLRGTNSFEHSVVIARIPRTVFGILAGAALAISGALMQAVTRNPIADPSILGVNTGASLFVVCGIAFFHINTGTQYIWLAFTGAAAGTALQSLVNTVMLPNTQAMDQFRFWQTGSISGASWDDIRLILPYLLVGFLTSFLLAPSLNTLALGDDTATGLGLNVTRIRTLAALSGVLLCASTTALAGPIGFLGLMVPHIIRLLLGPDMRKILPLSAVGGGCLMLLADVAGRILGRPGELESGIVTALAGAPVFIMIIRKVKVRAL